MCEDPKTSPGGEFPSPEPYSSMATSGPAAPEPVQMWIKIEKFESEDHGALLPASPPRSAPPSPLQDETSSTDPSLFLQVKYETPSEDPRMLEEDGNSKLHIRGNGKALPIGEYKCDICSRTFRRNGDLLRHARNCVNKKKIFCEICLKVFKNNYRLKSHLRRHETDTPHSCDQCGMRFKHRSSIARHRLLHERDGKPFRCPEPHCDKRFTSRVLMKPHLRAHTKEKPFQCAICLQHFAHKQNMERHMLRHNKLKHLTCHICHKSFPRESRLKYHSRVHWPDNRPFKCQQPGCRKAYSCRQNILRHYRKKHPGAEYSLKETDAMLASREWPKILDRYNQSTYIVPEPRASETEDIVPEPRASETGDDDVTNEPRPEPELVVVKSEPICDEEIII